MLDTFQVYNPLELNNLLKNELVIHRLIFTLQEVNIFFFFFSLFPLKLLPVHLSIICSFMLQ